MGTHIPGKKMVAAQVLFGLWATGLAVAAPQLDFGDSRSVRVVESSQSINQDQVVSDVVSALQPSIEAAIAEALASLRTTSTSVSTSTGSAFSSGSSGLAAQEPARYNYEYKVADEEAQNYISKSENRDGDTLTGTYSYVDPRGDLITVNYEAGPMGYSAVTEKQEGFVSIRQQSSGSSSASASGFTGATSGGFSTTSTTSSSSSVDQSDLIARIIASLQPQISSAVQSALAASNTVRETSRVATGRSAPVRDLAGTFGTGVSVNIDTPEYNINY